MIAMGGLYVEFRYVTRARYRANRYRTHHTALLLVWYPRPLTYLIQIEKKPLLGLLVRYGWPRSPELEHHIAELTDDVSKAA